MLFLRYISYGSTFQIQETAEMEFRYVKPATDPKLLVPLLKPRVARRAWWKHNHMGAGLGNIQNTWEFSVPTKNSKLEFPKVILGTP